MEAAITAAVAGKVKRIAVPTTQQVDGGDLLVEIEPA
jgi:pyruvate carboxylase